jgi:hypothetical protein
MFKNKTTQIAMLILVVLGGVLISGKSAFAATKTWTGNGSDNNFSTSGNWSPSGAPTSGDDLIFNLASLGSHTTPTNDVTGLSINSITANNGGASQLFSIIFEEDTTLAGNVTNTGANKITIDGGFILSGDVEISGGITLGSQPSSLNAVQLGSNTLTVSDYDGITSTSIPVTGAGSVAYKNLAQLQISGVNTYSGTTSFENVTQAFNAGSAPFSPTEMFGTSAITIDANSRVELRFSASATFSNQITLAATTVNGNTFNAQLNFSSEQVSATHAIAVPNIVLAGAGGMNLSPSQIASVDLAGIQANGNCLYVATTYEEYFLNAPTFCGAENTSSVEEVPGVPNTGDDTKKINPLVYTLIALPVSLAGLGYLHRRYAKK